jgi:hypothetical protein
VTWRPFDVMSRWVDAKALLPGVGLMWAYVAVAAALVAYEAVATSAEARDRGLLGRWERYQLFYFRLLNSSQVVVTLLVNAVLRVVYAPMRMEATPPEEEEAKEDAGAGTSARPCAAPLRRIVREASRDPFVVLAMTVLGPALVTHVAPFSVYYAMVPTALVVVLAACVALTRRYPAPDEVVDRRSRYVVRAVAVRALLRIAAQAGTVLTLQLTYNYAALRYERGAGLGYDAAMRVEWSARSGECWLEQWGQSAQPLLNLLP